MGHDREPKATPLGGRLGNWLRRPRATEHTGSERLPAEDQPPAVLLSEQELESLKRSYLKRLYARFRSLYLYGLDDRRQLLQRSGQALDLQAVYTPLNTTVRAPIERAAESSAPSSQAPSARTSSTRKSLSALELIGGKGRAIVRGPRGAGKSTLLRFLALSLAARSPQGECTGVSRLGSTWVHGCPLPVWVDLHGLANSPRNDGSAAGLCRYIASEWNLLADQLCDQLIMPGGLLFLIDGLEMAPNAAIDFYERFKQTDNLFLLTSQAYVDLDVKPFRSLKDLTEITLAPWTLDEMDQFVNRWYAELESKDWIDPEAARDLPGQLRAALRRDRLKALVQRPAVMTLVALLHTVNGQLPVSQVAFYDHLIDLCLAYWTDGRAPTGALETGVPAASTLAGDVSARGPLPETRDLRQAFDLKALQATIAKAAYDRYARLATPSDLVELSTSELRAALVQVVRDGRMEAVDALITRMRTRPALLDERRPGANVYAHPSLQIHAAAYHLAVQPDLPQLAHSLAHEDYARWREVILLAGIRLAELGEDLPAALELADALCYSPVPDAGQKQAPDFEWQLAWLAGEMLAEIAQEIEMPRPMQTIECVESWLAALLERGQLTPSERARAGSVLDRLPDGDRRPGVSSPHLLWCPISAGEFWQGEREAAQLAHISTFWMSRYPVTNAQYAAFIRATGQSPPSHWQGEHPPAGTGNHPVVHVTWKQAMQYCAWYSERLFSEPFLAWRLNRAERVDRAPDSVSRDWLVRLPTSQEWEKAARGGLQIPADEDEWVDNPLPRRTYPWSDSWHFSEHGARGDETRCNVSESDIGATTPVGMYPDGASPYGLMDMAGNVWEWCMDWADNENRYKVRRGGAYRFTHEHARCAAYDQAHPGLGWPHLGFRVVLAAPKP